MILYTCNIENKPSRAFPGLSWTNPEEAPNVELLRDRSKLLGSGTKGVEEALQAKMFATVQGPKTVFSQAPVQTIFPGTVSTAKSKPGYKQDDLNGLAAAMLPTYFHADLHKPGVKICVAAIQTQCHTGHVKGVLEYESIIKRLSIDLAFAVDIGESTKNETSHLYSLRVKDNTIEVACARYRQTSLREEKSGEQNATGPERFNNETMKRIRQNMNTPLHKEPFPQADCNTDMWDKVTEGVSAITQIVPTSIPPINTTRGQEIKISRGVQCEVVMTEEQNIEHLFSCALAAKMYNYAKFAQVTLLILVRKLQAQIQKAQIERARIERGRIERRRSGRAHSQQAESRPAAASQLTSDTDSESLLIRAMSALVTETEFAGARQQSRNILECAAGGNLANEALVLLTTAAASKSAKTDAAHNALKALLDILEFESRKGKARFRSTTKTIWSKSRLQRLVSLLPEGPKWIPQLAKQCAADVGPEVLRISVQQFTTEVSMKGKEKESTAEMETNNAESETVMFGVMKRSKVSKPLQLQLMTARSSGETTEANVNLSDLCDQAKTAIDLIFEGSKVAGGKPFEFGLIGKSQAVAKESTESLTFTTAVTFLLETLSQSFGSKTKPGTDAGDAAGAQQADQVEVAESVSPLEKARASLSFTEERIYWRCFNVLKGAVAKKRRNEKKKEKQLAAMSKLPTLEKNASWHTKLGHYLAITETLPPKNMDGKHANDVLLIDDLRFIGFAESPYHHALIDKATEEAELDTSVKRSSHWKAVMLRQDAVTDAAANHLAFTKTCPTRDPFSTFYKHFFKDSRLMLSELRKRLRPIDIGSNDEITFTLGDHAYEPGCPVFNSRQRRATITAVASRLRGFIHTVKLRVFRPPSSKLNYVLRPPSLRKVVPENDADRTYIIHVPLQLVEDTDEAHISEERNNLDAQQRRVAKKPVLLDPPAGSSSGVNLMDFDSMSIDEQSIDEQDLGGVAGLMDSPTDLLMSGLLKLGIHSTAAHQQEALKKLLENCARKQMGKPLIEMTKEQMEMWVAMNEQKDGAHDWIDVRVLRKLAEQNFNATPWTFDESRDPEALRYFPRNRHILVIRSGIIPNAHRLRGLRWISCDPGSRVFICAYDPITGDVYLIGSEMGTWVRTMHDLIRSCRSALDKAVFAKKAVRKAWDTWMAAEKSLTAMRRDPKSTVEERSKLALDVDTLECAYLDLRTVVSNDAEFLAKEAEIHALYRQLQSRVKAFHQIAVGFLQAFPIVILPRFDSRMFRRGGSGPQGLDKTVLTALSHAALYNLLCRRMATVGRRPLVPTEAFSSQACVFCGNLRNVGRSFIYKCRKCGNWWYRDGNGAAMICLLIIIRAMEWFGLD
ncbi:hypothetical protein BDZ88DRAFT_66169 [Geranomyces variabilis]|nr:hypothetical protein BDZ88DRAFT_66169 [Geranomyces variabilis]